MMNPTGEQLAIFASAQPQGTPHLSLRSLGTETNPDLAFADGDNFPAGVSQKSFRGHNTDSRS